VEEILVKYSIVLKDDGYNIKHEEYKIRKPPCSDRKKKKKKKNSDDGGEQERCSTE